MAEPLGLSDELRGCAPAAGLDRDGNLWLDETVIERVEAAFLRRLDPDYLEAVERARIDRCSQLVAAVRSGVEAVARSDGTGHYAALADIGEGLHRLAPYPILTKVVPALLLEALREAGDEGPLPFSNPSPGGRMSRSLLDLYERTRALDYSPRRLAAEWPEVHPAAVAAVRAFSHQHTGFGPVNWEAPGMETPRFVFEAMEAAFSGADPELLRARADQVPPPDPSKVDPGPGSWPGRLRGALRGWLEYTDLQIWYQRSAFYRGILPLLRGAETWIGDRGEVSAADLLFAQIDELLGGTIDAGVLAHRRADYWVDADYLDPGGVEPGRLSALMEGL